MKTFVDAYKAKYNEDPTRMPPTPTTMQLITKSLAASDSFEADDVKAGMDKVTGEGFDALPARPLSRTEMPAYPACSSSGVTARRT